MNLKTLLLKNNIKLYYKHKKKINFLRLYKIIKAKIEITKL